MVTATWVTDVRDLGIPALLGVLVGVVVTHRLSLGRQVLQDERAAATATEQALSQLETRAYGGPGSAGELRHEWTATVRPQAMRVNHPELLARVELVGKVLLPAHQTHEGDATWRPAVGACIDDARAGLRAYLGRNPLPPPAFPQDAEIQQWSAEGLDALFGRINASIA
jgi:hypothetical protein